MNKRYPGNYLEICLKFLLNHIIVHFPSMTLNSNSLRRAPISIKNCASQGSIQQNLIKSFTLPGKNVYYEDHIPHFRDQKSYILGARFLIIVKFSKDLTHTSPPGFNNSKKQDQKVLIS